MASAPAWGVFDLQGNLAFDADTVERVGYQKDAKTSDFPIERGGFASYNKVPDPFRVRVRLTVGGSSSRMIALERALDAAVPLATLYNVVTPERTYLNATLKGISYDRAAGAGANLLSAECTFEEIRQVDVQYATVAIPPSKAKDPGGTSKKNSGKNQPQDPSDPAFSSLTGNQALLLGVQKGFGY